MTDRTITITKDGHPYDGWTMPMNPVDQGDDAEVVKRVSRAVRMSNRAKLSGPGDYVVTCGQASELVRIGK